MTPILSLGNYVTMCAGRWYTHSHRAHPLLPVPSAHHCPQLSCRRIVLLWRKMVHTHILYYLYPWPYRCSTGRQLICYCRRWYTQPSLHTSCTTCTPCPIKRKRNDKSLNPIHVDFALYNIHTQIHCVYLVTELFPLWSIESLSMHQQ